MESGKKAAVVGGGLLGVEVASAFAKNGLEVPLCVLMTFYVEQLYHRCLCMVLSCRSAHQI